MNIDSMRLLNIKVILDDKNVIFEGNVDSAPIEIRKMNYRKINMSGILELYVYSEDNVWVLKYYRIIHNLE